MSGDDRPVKVYDRDGDVWVGSKLVAGRVDSYLRTRDAVVAVRERTSPDWWRRYADVVEATDAADTPPGGDPMADGIAFYFDQPGIGLVLDSTTAAVIGQDAFEAAREVIHAGVADAAARLHRNLTAFTPGATA